MGITFGRLRSWRAAGVKAGERRAAGRRAGAGEGPGRRGVGRGPRRVDRPRPGSATARQAALVAQMTRHIEGLADFERQVYAQVGPVTAIEQAVQDILSDAAAQQLEVDAPAPSATSPRGRPSTTASRRRSTRRAGSTRQRPGRTGGRRSRLPTPSTRR